MTDIAKLLKYEYDRREGRLRDIGTLSRGATDEQVADLLVDQAGNKEAGKSREYLRKRWITSTRFVPMIVPTAIVEPVRIPKASDSPSRTTGPIVVELNFKSHEQQDADGKKRGFIPSVIIIDGQHRHDEAFNRGQEFMHAIVGDKAIATVVAETFRWYALGAKGAERDDTAILQGIEKHSRKYAAFIESEHPRDESGMFAAANRTAADIGESWRPHLHESTGRLSQLLIERRRNEIKPAIREFRRGVYEEINRRIAAALPDKASGLERRSMRMASHLANVIAERIVESGRHLSLERGGEMEPAAIESARQGVRISADDLRHAFRDSFGDESYGSLRSETLHQIERAVLGANIAPEVHALIDDALSKDPDILRAQGSFGQPIMQYSRKYQRETGARATLEYREPASTECRQAGEVCEHCRHFISSGTKCSLFQLLGANPSVKPDSYCDAFV